MPLDEAKIAELAFQGCTAAEIARQFNVCDDTIRNRYRDLIAEKYEEGIMSRHPAVIDEQEVANLAFKGASNNEIAFLLGVDDQTIINRFSKLLSKKRAERRVWLRELQNSKAGSGDTTMLIWLGKNNLEQTDKMEQQHSGGVTINVVYEDVEPNAAAPAKEAPKAIEAD